MSKVTRDDCDWGGGETDNSCFSSAGGVFAGNVHNASCDGTTWNRIVPVVVRLLGGGSMVVPSAAPFDAPPGGGNDGASSWTDEIRATQHGVQRLVEQGGTKTQYLVVMAAGRFATQADGAEVRVARVGRNAHNVLILAEEGVVTALKGVTRHELGNLARNYGWTP